MTWVAVGVAATTVADGQEPPPACEFTWAADAELHRRLTAFAERVPNYSAVVNSCSWDIPSYVQVYFRVSPNTFELVFYLRQHREIYDAIVTARPVEAVARLISLERKLSNCRQLMKLATLYSTPLLLTPTSEEYATAQRLLYLVAWHHTEAGAAN